MKKWAMVAWLWIFCSPAVLASETYRLLSQHPLKGFAYEEMSANFIVLGHLSHVELWDQHTGRKRWQQRVDGKHSGKEKPCQAWIWNETISSICEGQTRVREWSARSGHLQAEHILPFPVFLPHFEDPLSSWQDIAATVSGYQPVLGAEMGNTHKEHLFFLGQQTVLQRRASTGETQLQIPLLEVPEDIAVAEHSVLIRFAHGQVWSWDTRHNRLLWRYQMPGKEPFYMAHNARWTVISNGNGQAHVLNPQGEKVAILQSDTRKRHPEEGEMRGAEDAHLLEQLALDGDYLLSASQDTQYPGLVLRHLPDPQPQWTKNIPVHEGLKLDYPWIWLHTDESKNGYCHLPACFLRALPPALDFNGVSFVQSDYQANSMHAFGQPVHIQVKRLSDRQSLAQAFVEQEERAQLVAADQRIWKLFQDGRVQQLELSDRPKRHHFAVGFSPLGFVARDETLWVWGKIPHVMHWDLSQRLLQTFAVPGPVKTLAADSDRLLLVQESCDQAHFLIYNHAGQLQQKRNGPTCSQLSYFEHAAYLQGQHLWLKRWEPWPTEGLLVWDLVRDRALSQSQLRDIPVMRWINLAGYGNSAVANRGMASRSSHFHLRAEQWHRWEPALQKWKQAQVTPSDIPGKPLYIPSQRHLLAPNGQKWRALNAPVQAALLVGMWLRPTGLHFSLLSQPRFKYGEDSQSQYFYQLTLKDGHFQIHLDRTWKHACEYVDVSGQSRWLNPVPQGVLFNQARFCEKSLSLPPGLQFQANTEGGIFYLADGRYAGFGQYQRDWHFVDAQGDMIPWAEAERRWHRPQVILDFLKKYARF